MNKPVRALLVGLRRKEEGDKKGYFADSAIFLLADDEGNETTRQLGLVVVRGTLLVVISPVDGSEVIANPFLQADED